MFYVDLNDTTFEITLTLGDVSTLTPPALRLVFNRKGTNETVSYIVPAIDVIEGDRFIIIQDIPTTIFAGSGQYNYDVQNYDIPATPVLIESGLFVVLTDDPISKKSYGTDKTRSEYKGHI